MEIKNFVLPALMVSLGAACQSPSRLPTQSPVLPPKIPASAAIPWSPAEGLPVLLRRAETSSPSVRIAFLAWQAALARVPQVTALPDPWLTLGGFLHSVETRTGPMAGRMGVTQAIPWPGKLLLAGQRAATLAEVTRMEVESARLQARRSFLRNWTERVHLEEAQSILAAQVLLLEQMEGVALRLYETSRVPQADVLRAQVEILEMVDRLASLRQRQDPLVAALEASLGQSLEVPASWRDLPFLDAMDLLPWHELRPLFLEFSPDLVGLQARIRAAEVGSRMADLAAFPNFSVGADWTWIGSGNSSLPDAGQDAFALSVGVQIPLQRGRIRGARDQSHAEERQASELLQRHQWDLLATLQTALSGHEDASRRVGLFATQLLPKAEQTWQATLSAYQSGQATFQDVLDSVRVVLDFRLAAARAAADSALAFADLNGLLPVAFLTPDRSQS